jgi:hypothetical protein
LYWCAQSAIKYNQACKNLYERLIKADPASGRAAKPKMVALIAVAAKLVKQAFAIAKSGLDFQPGYATK